MRRTLRCDRPAARQAHGRPSRGFTLVEAVIVIALTGIVAAVVARFIVAPVQAYLDTRARAELVDHADLALRRIGRDLQAALPNSARITASGRTLELIPTTAGARYTTQGAGALQFGVTDTAFDLVGPPMTVGTAQQLVFYNLGPGITGSDAYAANTTATEQASSNRRQSTTAAGSASSLSIVSLAPLPVGAVAPPHRVLAVASPVTYRCDLASGTLTRHQDYGFLAAQADPPTGGSAALLARGVTDCRFNVEGTLVAAHAALISLSLTLAATTTAGTERVALHHAVHVDNLP
jgi:MSHA biogenesis protein MshO